MPFEVQEPFDERGHSAARQRYEQARRLMEAGGFEEAAALVQEAGVEQPHVKTYELLGECYVRLKRFGEAVPFLAAATTLNRGVRAPALLAETWLALGRHREAVEAADIALSRDPKNRAALQIRER